MATTTTDPWGLTPLTTEGLANLGHPLSLSDFNQDGAGYWRIIRGQKTYYPREWFDATGTFTGTGTQPGDRAGQDSNFLHQGTKWNWTTGQWENPTNWANVIGLAAAGGVGAGIAAPVIAGALGGPGGFGPLAGGYGAATTSATVPDALALTGGGPGVGRTIAQIFGLGGTGGGMANQVIPTLIQSGLGLIGTNKQVNANQDAAAQQAAATKYAADLQAKAAADSLANLKQQAAYDAASAESTRGANYQQWAARQQMLGSVGQMLGLPARSIPAYVPLPAYPVAAPASTTAPTTAQQTSAQAFMPTAVANNPTAARVPQTPGPYATTAPPAAATAPGAAAWWNPADPKGSLSALLAGKAPTSQTLLSLKPQFDAAGIQISPANAEGITSKINVPGVGWTRVLDGGVAGGQGTGWTFVPQGTGAATTTAPATARVMAAAVDPLAAIRPYLTDAAAGATGRLVLPDPYDPRTAPYGGPVGAYL